MRKWRYNLVGLSEQDERSMLQRLDEWGEQGWELVSVVINTNQYEKDTQYLAFMKKPEEK